MEKELKEYLDRIAGDISDIKETMATKDELAEVEKNLSARIDKVDRKLTKKINETLDYVKAVDEDISAHRRNTEAHIKPLRKA